MRIKKIISAVVSGAIILSTSALTSFAQSYGDGKNVMVFGDSIASGYGLSSGEYTYGQIIADYIEGSVENYAVPGSTSSETLDLIRNFDAAQKDRLANTDLVIISTGGNDMISYAAKSLLQFAELEGLLKDGKTAADFPDHPSLNDVSEFMDEETIKEYVNDFAKARTFNDRLDSIYRNIAYTDANVGGSSYSQVIAKQVVPNIEAMVTEIRNVNPNAEIVVQTVYNPMQYEAAYEDALKASLSASYMTAYIKVKTIFNQTTLKFSEQIKNIEGVKIADVLTEFSSTDNDSQSYGWYFTKMQEDRENMDFHPNQAGHVAIAVSVLNAIGESREDGGLLGTTFMNLANAEKYPSYALSNYEKVKGDYCLGDADGDGIINSNDASKVLEQYSLIQTGKNTTLPESQLKACDVNHDGSVDSSDSSIILAYYSFTSTGGNASIKEYLNQ